MNEPRTETVIVTHQPDGCECAIDPRCIEREAATPPLDARCPTCGREAIPASITTGHKHGPMETCDECQYHFTEQDGEAATPLLDVERLRLAILTRDFSTVHRCDICYEAEAQAIAAEYARLAQQDGAGE